MMKKILMLVLISFCLSACQTKDSYIEDFKEFVENVKDEMKDYTENDWKEIDEKFKDLSTIQYNKFEGELSDEEKAEVAKLQATYVGLKLKTGVRDVSKRVDKFLDGIKEKSK